MANSTGPTPQFNDLSISEKLKYSTVRVVCEYNDGKSGSGTAFVVQFRINDQHMFQALVTNKHVIKNLKNGYVVFHFGDIKDGQISPKQEFLKADFEGTDWIPHPENDVDLCALPFSHFLQEWYYKGKPVFAPAIPEDLFALPAKMEELQDLEQILMVGYPIGLWDEVNNYPLFRTGITATSPRVDYNGKKVFLIDAACFPGSSGSPVFIYNQGTYSTKQGAIVVGSRLLFLGVLFAGPQHTVTETVIKLIVIYNPIVNYI